MVEAPPRCQTPWTHQRSAARKDRARVIVRWCERPISRGCSQRPPTTVRADENLKEAEKEDSGGSVQSGNQSFLTARGNVPRGGPEAIGRKADKRVGLQQYLHLHRSLSSQLVHALPHGFISSDRPAIVFWRCHLTTLWARIPLSSSLAAELLE